MYKVILIPTDGSEFAQKGLNHGLNLAKSVGAKVTIVTVTEPFPIYAGAAASAGWASPPMETGEYEASQTQAAEKTLADARAAADRLGVDAETVHVPQARPAEGIVKWPITATAASLSWHHSADAGCVAFCSAARPPRCSRAVRYPFWWSCSADADTSARPRLIISSACPDALALRRSTFQVGGRETSAVHPNPVICGAGDLEAARANS